MAQAHNLSCYYQSCWEKIADRLLGPIGNTVITDAENVREYVLALGQESIE